MDHPGKFWHPEMVKAHLAIEQAPDSAGFVNSDVGCQKAQLCAILGSAYVYRNDPVELDIRRLGRSFSANLATRGVVKLTLLLQEES